MVSLFSRYGKIRSELDIPAVAVDRASKPGRITRAIGKRALDRIPVEAGIVDIAHIA